MLQHSNTIMTHIEPPILGIYLRDRGVYKNPFIREGF